MDREMQRDRELQREMQAPPAGYGTRAAAGYDTAPRTVAAAAPAEAKAETTLSKAAPSNASSALDDMCRLSRTSMVVQASLQSHFASVAAIIGPGKMVVFEGTSNEATRPHTRGWEEAGALEVVGA